MLSQLRARIPIAWLATAATLAPLLTIATLLLWMSANSAARSREALGRQVIDASAQRIEESLTRNIKLALGLSDSLALLIQDGTIDPDGEEKWRSRLFAHLHGNPEVAGIIFVNASLHSVFAGRYEDRMEFGTSDPITRRLQTYPAKADGTIDVSSRRELTDYDIRTRPFFKLAVESTAPVWTPAYHWLTDKQRAAVPQWSVGYTRVIRARSSVVPTTIADASASPRATTARARDTDILGVLCVDLSLPQFEAFLKKVAQPLHATMYIADGDGHVLGAYADDTTRNSTSASELVDPVLHALVARVGHHPTLGALPSDTTSRIELLNVAGRVYWAKRILIEASPSDSWYLMMAIPQDVIFAGVNAEAWSLWWISLACVIVAGIIAAALARALSRPFGRLAAFADGLGSGDFDRRIVVNENLEVSQLGEALNAMAANLSERVALKAQTDAAVEGNALKARLIAHMSHEFRTPLNAIIGYAELLSDAAIAESRARDAADAGAILTASNHLLALVENLLDLSAIEAGRLRLELSEFSISGLLEDVARTCRPEVERFGNKLTIIGPAAGAPLVSDPTRVRQILINLVANAGKFTNDGQVTVTASAASDGGFTFTVIDNGPGIAPQLLPRIFEPLTGNAYTPTARAGAGLGLAISRQLARALCGDISVVTGSAGTRMTVVLPPKPPNSPR